jgi:hypothetical protein
MLGNIYLIYINAEMKRNTNSKLIFIKKKVITKTARARRPGKSRVLN